MKLTIKKEVEAKFLHLSIAVRYEDDDIPYDFPLRLGDLWVATIDLHAQEIVGWPKGKSGELRMKVTDEGTYRLLDIEGNELVKLENDYVPNALLPGEYGDYIDLRIDENGKITNWLKNPSLSDFEDNE